MQFRRVIDYLEGICILHNDPGIAQNLEITEQKSELTITNLTVLYHIVPNCGLDQYTPLVEVNQAIYAWSFRQKVFWWVGGGGGIAIIVTSSRLQVTL